MKRLLLATMATLLLLPAAYAQNATPSEGAPPSDASSYFERGMTEEKSQQWDAAIADFSAAIRLQPDYLACYMQRAKVYARLDKFDNAIADYSEVIHRNPELGSAYDGRGSMYLLAHKPELAGADAEQEIRLEPGKSFGYLLRSAARMQMGDETGAASDQAKVAELQAASGELAQAMPLRIGGSVMAANIVRKVVPEYPEEARQARIQGTVKFSVVIGKDGSIGSLQLISGHPLLVQSAKTAVQQWHYKPTLLNGEPVPVMTTVSVTFALRQ